MSIPPRFLDELRNRLALSDIVGKRVKLMRAGREYKAPCPFHSDKSPSFTVNDDKQFYHCFGCGAHGDIIGFVMQYDNLAFPEAVEQLAALAGMTVPEQSPQDVQKAKDQKDLYSLVEVTTKWFVSQLYDQKHKFQLEYMRERGVSEELMQVFRIGFAPSDGDALFKYLKAQGYKTEQMLEAGVVKESTRGGDPYAFFRDRIIFPVADRRGRVVAFGGRILPEHMRPPDRGDFKPPKYINSSDTPLFHKGRMLFGESHARQAAADGQPVIVVEGYLDVMACFGAGYRGAVAPLGTALTDEQIQALWKMIPGREKVPVLCFDGDEAGRRAARRAADNILPFLQPDHSAVIAFLPEGEDPDSLVKKEGKKALEAVLAGALPLADFIWATETAGHGFTTPESRAGLEKVLGDHAARIADRTVQEYYKRAFREKLNEAFAVKRPQQSQPRRDGGGKWGGGRGNKRGGFGTPEPVGLVLKRPAPAGLDSLLSYQILLATLINHPEIFDAVEDEAGRMVMNGDNMANKRLDLLRQAVLNLLGSEPGLDAMTLQNHLKERGFEDELAMVLSEAVYVHAGFARVTASSEDTMGGWRDTMDTLQRKAVWQELRAAGAVLGQDMSPENEERLRALHDVHKGTDG